MQRSTDPISSKSLARRSVAAAIALVIGTVLIFGSLIWVGVGINQVRNSPNPHAELESRPVLRRVIAVWDAVSSRLPGGDTERTYVMPDGNQVREDGTIVGREPPLRTDK